MTDPLPQPCPGTLRLEPAGRAGAGKLGALFGGSLQNLQAWPRALLDAHERLASANDGIVEFDAAGTRRTAGADGR